MRESHAEKNMQIGVDLDGENLPVEVIQDGEGTEPAAVIQRVAHEVDRPALVRCLRHCQGAGFLVGNLRLPFRRLFSRNSQ